MSVLYTSLSFRSGTGKSLPMPMVGQVFSSSLRRSEEGVSTARAINQTMTSDSMIPISMVDTMDSLGFPLDFADTLNMMASMAHNNWIALTTPTIYEPVSKPYAVNIKNTRQAMESATSDKAYFIEESVWVSFKVSFICLVSFRTSYNASLSIFCNSSLVMLSNGSIAPQKGHTKSSRCLSTVIIPPHCLQVILSSFLK